jgi:hypothetical protein
MSDDIEYPKNPGNGKVIVGVVLLVLGVGFLLDQLHLYLVPRFLFHWPTILVIWGLYAGARHNFRSSGWLIVLLIGLACMANYAFPDTDVGDIVWPVALIALGLWLLLRRNHQWDKNDWGKKWEGKWENKWEGKWNNKFGGSAEPVITPVTPVTPADPGPANPSPSGSTNIPPSGSTNIPPTGTFGGGSIKGDDYLDTVSVFGGVKKTIFSKNFRGGEIVNIFGGAELDFTQADINGRVVIDITQIFGGTKIVVPSNWKVISAVFASVDDKRLRTPASYDTEKVLVLKGVSIFAGVDVRSY